MNRCGILSAVGLISLSACATQSSVVLVAEGDDTVPFDAMGSITVSTESNTIQAANLKTALRDTLAERGFRLSDGINTDYTLTIDPVRKNYSYTAHDVVSTLTTANARLGSQTVVIDGTSYSSIPYTATATYEGFVAELYDWKLDHAHPLLIWHGVIAADAGQIAKQQTDALSLLVLNLGKSVKKTVRLERVQSTVRSPPVEESVWTVDASYFFGTQSESILEMVGITKGMRYDGYIRTRPLNTSRFHGYLQSDGLSKYRGPFSADEIDSWDFGLGVYVIRPDGIYTKHVPLELRDLDTVGLQKVISFPLEIGSRHEIGVVDDMRMSVEIMAKEGTETPFKKFDDCFKIRRGLGRTDQAESWEFNTLWVCRGVGIVKELVSTGRVDSLVNVQAVR